MGRFVLNFAARRVEGAACLVYLEDRLDQPYTQLDESAVSLLESFRKPTEIEAIVPAHDGTRRRLIQSLIDLRLLVPADHLQSEVHYCLVPASYPAFGLPTCEFAESLEGAVLIVGACSDEGTLPVYVRGAAKGPDAIRQASAELSCRLRLDDGRQLGWYDVDSGRALLESARLFDAGNLVRRPGAPTATYGKALGRHLRQLGSHKARMLLLGGDHSLSLNAIEALERSKLGIIHFDAHSDLGPLQFADDLNHGNVARWILENQPIEHFLQIGLRGIQRFDPRSSSSVYQCLTASKARALPPEEIRELCKPDLPYYITVDIDVLDPAVAPDTAAPVPGGLTLSHLKTMIRTLGETVDVVGADLMEVMPSTSASSMTGRAAAETALELLHALARFGRSGT